MYVYTVSFDSTLSAYDNSTGVQGVFTSIKRAEEYMRQLAAMYNDDFTDKEDVDFWQTKYWSKKGIYTIDRMELDYLMDDTDDDINDDVDESNYDPFTGGEIYEPDIEY